ncbi:MAG: hypothetical protein SPM02_09415, partial [Bacteroidales bacterium]|nr:hypothetical protein [Bacteroidales bacterium]
MTNVVQSRAKSEAKNYINSEQVKKQIAARTSNDALALAIKDSLQNAREAHYLDSMANEKVYLGYTYRQCQGREINLGLDLKGGMNVMLEVSTVDVVRALAGNTEDQLFNQAVTNALAKQKVTTNSLHYALAHTAAQSSLLDHLVLRERGVNLRHHHIAVLA